jgi:PST family polysaccharide transporter
MLITIPAAAGVAALSVPIVNVVLGPKWAEAAEIVKLLAIFGIMRSVSALSASAFMSSGQVKAFAGLSIIHLFLRVVALSLGFMLGDVIGLAWGVLVAAAIQMCASIYVQHSLRFINIMQLLSGIWRTVSAALVMYFSLTLYFFDLPAIAALSGASRLVIQVLAGAAIYLLSIAILWLSFAQRNGPEQAVVSFLKQKLSASKSSE